MEEFSYKVNYTGSSGNCVNIDWLNIKLLVDIGKPYKYIKPHLDGVKFIFITHVHGDHLNYSAYKNIRLHYPSIKIISNNEVNERLLSKDLKPVDILISSGLQLKLGKYLKVNFIENYHDVDCQGFIFEGLNEHLLYATDLSTIIEYEAFSENNNVRYDCMLLEANYDIKKLVTEEDNARYDYLGGAARHLEKGISRNFFENYSKENAIYEPLHMSSRFY